MDIFAHALWTGALCRIYNLQQTAKHQLNIWFAVFWGIFPDMFAFLGPITALSFSMLRGKVHILGWPYPGMDSLFTAAPSFYNLIRSLYSISHSLVIFFFIFFLIWAIRKKPVWEMGGWLLHILIDIPTHGDDFTTPFLWPLKVTTFHGISWHNPTFQAINYAAAALAWFIIWQIEKHLEKKSHKTTKH